MGGAFSFSGSAAAPDMYVRTAGKQSQTGPQRFECVEINPPANSSGGRGDCISSLILASAALWRILGSALTRTPIAGSGEDSKRRRLRSPPQSLTQRSSSSPPTCEQGARLLLVNFFVRNWGVRLRSHTEEVNGLVKQETFRKVEGVILGGKECFLMLIFLHQ